MKFRRRLLCLILACFCLSGCTFADTEQEETDRAETENSGTGYNSESTAEVSDVQTEKGSKGDNPIEDYVIVYDASKMLSVRTAHRIAEAFLSNRGISLSLLPDSYPAAENEIIIGETNRNSGNVSLENDAYSIKCGKGNVTFRAGSALALYNATDVFVAAIRNDDTFEELKTGTYEANGKVKFISGATAETEAFADSNLRVMSFNILSEAYNDKTPLEGRDLAVAKTVMTYLPDVVGFEETTETWHRSLDSLLDGDYSFVEDEIPGVGKSMSTLMYRTDTVEYIESRVIPYSASSNQMLRNLTWARFRLKESKEEFIVTCTHWDINTNAENRLIQVKENGEWLNELIAKYGLPIFCCGDYNRNETTEEFLGFLSATGLSDSILEARKTDFGAKVYSDTSGCIDHIVFSSNAKLRYYTKLKNSECLKASDHYPVYSDFLIENTKKSGDAAKKPQSYVTEDINTHAVLAMAGDGSAETPYLIENPENLYYLSEAVNSGVSFAAQYIKFSADIALDGSEWVPIGYSGYPFSGNLDGDFHTVSGIKITKNRQYNRFFGLAASYKTSCTVKSLTVKGEINVNNAASGTYTGGFAGFLGFPEISSLKKTYAVGIINDIKITVSGSASLRVGGVFGYAAHSETEGCQNRADLTVTNSAYTLVAGIAAQSIETVFKEAVNAGNLSVSAGGTSTATTAGICAVCTYSSLGRSLFSLCENRGNIVCLAKGNSAYAAGILGSASSSGDSVNVLVEKCVNYACRIRAEANAPKLGYAAGIVAYCSVKDFTVEGCVNMSSDITGIAGTNTRSGGIFSVFNLPSAESAIVCRNCLSVMNIYAYNKNLVEKCKSNASLSDCEAAIAGFR